ncbi:MAG TPA: CDP-alcohol phosphatidyltransferase family protein [Candidatus Saccharimonadales bacterium]|nr:CDP-alcohol phosphatidyltransferase family protein [Candidatus Saccharimonadales bacterium]HSW96419.1 CDP-alcohol phosphatidyltransferase family protein [Candidatus Saccharimonadales bacterium]
MLSKEKPKFEKYLDPLAKKLAFANPNTLTLIGSIPSLFFFVSVINHWYLLALISFFGYFFDLIDGMIARKYNKVTNFGGFLDSTIDRVSDFLTIMAFSFGSIVRWEIAVVALMLSFLTSYVRAHGELRSMNKLNFARGLIERPERLILIFFSLVAYIILPRTTYMGFNSTEWIFLLLIILSAYTVMQRIIFAYKNL